MGVSGRPLRPRLRSREAERVVLRAIAIGTTVAAIVAGASCTRNPRWLSTEIPNPQDARLALDAAWIGALERDPEPDEIPDVPMRSRLRPCCAFGVDLATKIGKASVPTYRIGNLLGPDQVGPHTYDSGVLHIRQGHLQKPLLNNENNGLVYTCRGGFIDIAHVRDYADWSMFIGAQFARALETGTTLSLPDEGGVRTISLKPVPLQILERYGRVRAAVALSQWVAFQLSVWHEIATWYGWSSVPVFPEKVSAFSPEDLYSNLLGIKVAMMVTYRRSARSENLYNAAVTQWLDEVLAVLGAVPRDVGREAMAAVDGLWWDSSKRLPDPSLTLRRNLDIDRPLSPWLVPDSRSTEKLREHCPSNSRAQRLRLRSSFDGIDVRSYATLRIDVDDELASQSPFPDVGRVVTQEDFPAIVEAVREQNREEFGPDADSPD